MSLNSSENQTITPVNVITWPTVLIDTALESFKLDFEKSVYPFQGIDPELITLEIKSKRLTIKIKDDILTDEQKQNSAQFINSWITTLIGEPGSKIEPKRPADYSVKINLNGHIGQIYPISTPEVVDEFFTITFVFLEWN